jgi:glycosyltransferase involved in cell wall biosynthesis
MNENPKVSVIIPVYNREHLVQRAIKSILNQTYDNLEVIVVDDGSSDNSEAKVIEIKDSRLRYLKNERNMGVSRSRNEGIKISTGEIIAFQDSDDESYPDRIEKELKLLMNSPEDVAGVYCGMELYDYNTGKKIADELNQADFRKNFKEGSYILTPGTGVLMLRKSVLEDVGYLDETIRAAVDVELAMRISRKYRFECVNEFLVKVTRDHDQIMGNQREQILAKEYMYEKHRDFLGKNLLYEECKQIANYYILTNNIKKAKSYAAKSLKYRLELKTILQFLGLIVAPSLVKNVFIKKYEGEIPLTSGLKRKPVKEKAKTNDMLMKKTLM